MPIYEYVCPTCGTAFEKLVRGSSAAVTCPTCGSPEVRKKVSTFAASVQGSSGASLSGGSAASSCAPTGL